MPKRRSARTYRRSSVPALGGRVHAPVMTVALASILIFYLGGLGPARASTSFEILPLDHGKRIRVAIHLPDNFDPDQTYPVVIGPGRGTPGSDPGIFWGENPYQFGWIIVETMAFLRADPAKVTAKVFDYIQETFHVEGGRFHLVGFSANSAGAFAIALALPERLFSITGVPGYPRTADPGELKRLTSVKVQIIVGERDAYWLKEARASHDLLEKLGVECTVEVVKDGRHVLQEMFGAELIKRMERLRPQK